MESLVATFAVLAVFVLAVYYSWCHSVVRNPQARDRGLAILLQATDRAVDAQSMFVSADGQLYTKVTLSAAETSELLQCTELAKPLGICFFYFERHALEKGIEVLAQTRELFDKERRLAFYVRLKPNLNKGNTP